MNRFWLESLKICAWQFVTGHGKSRMIARINVIWWLSLDAFFWPRLMYSRLWVPLLFTWTGESFWHIPWQAVMPLVQYLRAVGPFYSASRRVLCTTRRNRSRGASWWRIWAILSKKGSSSPFSISTPAPWQFVRGAPQLLRWAWWWLVPFSLSIGCSEDWSGVLLRPWLLRLRHPRQFAYVIVVRYPARS